jgi:hypothetical protein
VAAAGWDPRALASAAEAKASQVEDPLWMVRLMGWLRHASIADEPAAAPLLRLRLRQRLRLRLRLRILRGPRGVRRTLARDCGLHRLTLLGPTASGAAFAGVLLLAGFVRLARFVRLAGSLIAGCVGNGFVLHRLDSATACSPRLFARLGAGLRNAGRTGGATTSSGWPASARARRR